MDLAPLLQPFRPPFETARRYDLHKLRRDLIAGLTVSVVEVPQAMAYAIVAGVPPQYGLYTSVIQGIVGALLSSSEHMTTGPTNTQSLLIASALHRILAPSDDPARYLHLVFCLTFMKGLIQLSFAAAGLGNAVRYVSRSVISGLVSGAGLLIFFGQLPAFLGIRSHEQSDIPGILRPILRIVHFHGELNPRAVVVGVAVVALIVGVRRISKMLPGSLAAVALSCAAVWGLGWTHAELPLIDALPRGVPHFELPWTGWRESEQLFGGALALAVVGMLESVAIAKSIAVHTGEEISANQEFFAQGFKNTLTSFFQCIPGSGSFSRSALDHAAGAATRFAAVFNALFVAAIFWLCAGAAGYLPRASLAGVLFVIAYGLLDARFLLTTLRTHRSDAAVFLATFLATLFAPLEYAVLAGVILNIGLFLRTSGRLRLIELVPTSAGTFTERELPATATDAPIVIVQLQGDLFFGQADDLVERLSAVLRGTSRVLIIRMRRTQSIDASVLEVLKTFVGRLQQRGGHVVLCGIAPDLRATLAQSGLIDRVGGENVIGIGEVLFGGLRRAIARAEVLAGAPLAPAKPPSEWAYSI
jgi:SulP family sulfate permease